MKRLKRYTQMVEELCYVDKRTRFIFDRMDSANNNGELEKVRIYEQERRKEMRQINKFLRESYLARLYWWRLGRLSSILDVFVAFRISSPPGQSLRSLAEFFCSPKTMELVVNPILADLHIEYCDALQQRRKAKAIWVRLRGYWSFWTAVSFYRVVKLAADIWTGTVGIKK